MSYDSLMNAYDVLLNASGILFGILGLWVGIFYLEAVKNSTEPEKYKQAVKQSNDLLQPFFFSLVSFFITFLVVFLTPFFKVPYSKMPLYVRFSDFRIFPQVCPLP